MSKKSRDQFSKKEADQRFEAALKGARLVKRENDSSKSQKPKKARR
jgi:hypothetical protein